MELTLTDIGQRLVLWALLLPVLAGCGDVGPAAPAREIVADVARPDEGLVVPEVVFAEVAEPDVRDVANLELRPDDGGGDVWTPTPCTENSDCASDFCLQVNPSTGESFCTEPCIEGCPGNWECKLVYFDPPDLVSLCVPPTDTLCAVCGDDADCLFAGALCVRGEELYGYCGRACSVGKDCPTEYSCAEVVVEGLPAKQCLPGEGNCCESGLLANCDDGNPCTVESCHPTMGCVNDPLDVPCDGEDPCLDYWCEGGTCTGAPKAGDYSLDGVDDDCDGETDEDALVSLSVVGHVWASGRVSCQGGGVGLDGTVGAVTFSGETSDGTYVIRSGLPQFWEVKE